MHAMIITHGQAVTILWSTVAIAVGFSGIAGLMGYRLGWKDGHDCNYPPPSLEPNLHTTGRLSPNVSNKE